MPARMHEMARYSASPMNRTHSPIIARRSFVITTVSTIKASRIPQKASQKPRLSISRSHDRQKILLETLRVLKKGGTFALHDIFSKAKYGDMQAFVRLLREMGYEEVELIDTTDGMFMSPTEAKWMALSGSALLLGKK